MFGSQDSFDPFDRNCGNGLQGGSPLPSDPARDGKPVGASYSGAWVRNLVNRYGGAAAGGVSLYELGNEPALWSHTHRDMHPQATTYDELGPSPATTPRRSRTPTRRPRSSGSRSGGGPTTSAAAPTTSSRAARRAPPTGRHTEACRWSSGSCAGCAPKSAATGPGCSTTSTSTTTARAATTTDVTRSLWDPTYTDPSWIGERIRLIPRMKEWVADNYRHTKLAITEYNLSVPGDAVTNGLIQADVLGIFAREGLDLATRWGMPDDGDRIDDAFRLYRDYDGAGAKFGNVWIRSTSADQGRLAVYGARRGAAGDYTVMVINKTGTGADQPPRPRRDRPGRPAEVYRWTGAAIRRLGDRAVPADGFSATYPARSATVYEIPG